LQRFSHGSNSWEGLIRYRAELQSGGGLLSSEDMDALFNAALKVPEDGIIAEIGSFRGCSTVHLAAGACMVKAKRVYAIDPFRPNGGGETLRYPHYWMDFIRTIQTCGVEHMVTVLADYSQRVVDLFRDESIDLLFIDGDHSAEGVKRDYELYVSKVKPGGLILFHDATYGPVARFLSEIGGVVPVTELIAALFRPEGAQESDPK